LAEAKPIILVADDEENMRNLLQEVLQRWGYKVVTAASGPEALDQVSSHSITLAILDLKMPKISGMDVLVRMKEHYPEVPVVILTAYATVRDAVQAIKQGAFDYLTKPFQLEELQLTVEKAFRLGKIARENQMLKQQLKYNTEFQEFIGCSPKVQVTLHRAAKVAPTDYTVMLSGESGTGKSLLARLIHKASNRAKQPFVTVNCAAMPENLLESELFGHEKGAFTGAVKMRMGKFEQAHGGTLFLDEVSTMSQPMQAKLLFAIQEKKFERVGGHETINADVRIVAASNRDLKTMVNTGEFREDLYFRLNVVPIEMVPLRQRREDIPLLVDFILNSVAIDSEWRVAEEAMGLLMSHNWPGNVRELENVLKQALALGEAPEIKSMDLPPALTAKQDQALDFKQGDSLGEILNRAERQVIIDTLARCQWKRSLTAQKLRISRRSLYNKLEKLKISPDREKERRLSSRSTVN